MSRHWVSYLLVPIIVGLVVESLLGWYALEEQSLQNLGDYFLSREGLIAHMSIASLIATFLIAAVVAVHKEAKPPWTDDVGNQLEDFLLGAKSFFATCTIPLEEWFHPDTQRYFSHLVKDRLAGQQLTQHRILLFKQESDLVDAQEQYLDAYYAKSLAAMHRNYEIPLGYLRPQEVAKILQSFSLSDRAAAWNEAVDTSGSATNKDILGNISTLDFAVVGFGNTQYRVFTFDKTGDRIELDEITDVEPYVHLRNEMRRTVFNDKGLPNPKHDFAGHLSLTTLKATQPFPD